MRYIIAISGGVDSVVLAHTYCLQNRCSALVHINHHTRGIENEKEVEIVKTIGDSYSVPVYVFDYFHTQGNFQNEARKYRYSKLVEIAKKYNAKILTAHHLDDQLENCMQAKHDVKSNLIKYQSKINGVKIIRPLIGMNKEKIYQIAENNSYVYNEDISNFTNHYTRNSYRILLYDELVKNQVKKDYILETIKEQMLDNCEVNKVLDRDELRLQNELTIKLKVYKYLKKYDPTSSVKNSQLAEICKLVKKSGNSIFYVANSKELFIVYDKIYMLTKSYNIKQSGTIISGINCFNGISFEHFDTSDYIRTWQPGDKVAIKGGHKKVARIFIDNKIDPNLRKCWPIVVNGNNKIVYIPKLWRKNEIN